MKSLKSYRRQLGINLIEVMVAMAIGLFLVLGATALYVKSKATANVDDSIARLQETARYAMSVIESDVRMANYWGLTKDGGNFENKDSQPNQLVGANASAQATSLSANYCGAVYATNTEQYVGASDNAYNVVTIPVSRADGIPTACPARYNPSLSADTLTVRRVNTAVAAASATQVQVCSTRNTANVIRSATAICANGEIHNLVTNAYYIDRASDQGAIPSLRRKSLINGPAFTDVEIIPGVEDMQIELGWDNSDSDSAGAVRYIQPSALNTLPSIGRIVAVRVWLLIRAEAPDPAFTDTQTYSYAGRTGTAVSNLNVSDTGADDKRYSPNDHFRRLLVSRTIFIRNATGT